MPASIGVNLRVTGHCSQGGRKYMEDLFSVAYQQTEDERDLEYAFFGIYDGHGGSEAAAFAKEHLMDSIVKQRQFWSDNDEDVLKAIRNGYMLTHLNMWKELEKWPKTVTGLPSTAGTTASVAFIRRGKIYIGHVGDSAIVLGYQKDGSEEWAAKPLTSDHKPESTAEIERIQRCGGKVISKAGVPRVVWNRPRVGHKGPIKKNTPMDEIPFLAVARSLGDLWSYNPQNDEFIVSPDPDVGVLTIDPTKFRCLIFGTDGLWNMISPEGAVNLVQATERHNEAALVSGNGSQPRDWLNPSKSLVDHALERWSNTRMRADNTSVVTLMLDPPGPPRATVLRSRTTAHKPAVAPPLAACAAPPAPPAHPAHPTHTAPAPAGPARPAAPDAERPVPQNGLTIMTRYSDAERPAASPPPLPPCASIDARLSVAPHEPAPRDSSDADDADPITTYGNPAESYFMARLLNRTRVINTLADVYEEIASGHADDVHEPSPPPPVTVLSEGDVDSDPLGQSADEKSTGAAGDAPPTDEEPSPAVDDGGIQINEVSSSSPVEAPPRPRGRRPRTDVRRDAPVVPDRVLRSHHEDGQQRPQTRQAATRGRPAGPPSLDRVVILNRRAPPAPPVQRSTSTETVPPPRRLAPAPSSAEPAPLAADDDDGRRGGRATRSHAPSTPLAQKITRSIGGVARELRAAAAGNSARAPGPARRAPAARLRADRSKENLGAATRRARARAAPAPPRRPRRADSAREPLVHSTSGEERPRALRSRNEPAAPAAPPAKRARCDDRPPLGKRAAGPWAPAPPLRHRLRRRLAK
ncbi:serine/arginine repetitive matrix protein 1 [Achroia grisella]|uniref:serine/arginine repetitive matrix protein 1 n=1 Tax=Achroia grisella TaxID=688607 RepID=UPI0027D26759|nr:serine/arginine repetitive matrix protein 1 [Achroia grisella]